MEHWNKWNEFNTLVPTVPFVPKVSIMDFYIEKYNQYNLKEGAKYSVCPICSTKRRKKHQKCMMLDWQTGIGTCQHCGEVIQLHSYKRNNDKPTKIIPKPTKIPTKIITKSTKAQRSIIDNQLLVKSRNRFKVNNLYTFLISIFGHIKAKELTDKYYLGTAKHWKGATVFWQIDQRKQIRTGKIMLYNANSGKRIKQPFNHIAWVHKVLKIEDFNLEQCFYGEHLITKFRQIAIVESEKTAIIASGYLPQYIWLAVGSLNNLSANRCKVLEGKTITLYPDLNAYDKWCEKAKQIEKKLNIKFIVSDLLEQKATYDDKQQGLDLADYLIKHNYKQQYMSKDMQNLDKMINQNSNLLHLINTFDLELL
jgi:hypothetical protein